MDNPYYDAIAARVRGADAPTDVNPYVESINERVNAQQRRARTVFENALGINPDQAAQSKKLMNATGLPLSVIERNLDEVKRKEQARMLDLARMTQDSPVLARQLVDPTFTNQAHDDVENLSALEQVFNVARAVPAGAAQGVGALVAGSGEIIDIGARATGLTAVSRAVKELTGFDPGIALDVAGSLKFAGSGWKMLADAIGPAPENKNFATDVAAGIGQLLQQIGVQIATGGTASLVSLFSQGADVMADKTKGDKASQAVRDTAVLTGATITALTEKYGIDKLLNRVPPAIKNSALRWIADKLVAGGIEATQEITEGVLQDIVRVALTNSEAPIGDGALYEGSVAGTSAAIVRAALGIRARDSVEQQRRTEAEQHAERMKGLLQAATGSLLRERNPEEFRTLVQAMADNTEGAPSEVYVDAEVLNQLAPEVLAQLPGVAAQMADALAANSVVSIPVGDVLTVAPGTPLEQLLVENARIGDPTAMSQLEAKQAGEKAQEFLAQEAQRVIQQATDQQAMQESSDRVKQTLLDQLNTVGRDRPAVNDTTATLYASMYTTLAGDMGINKATGKAFTPEEAFALYGVNPVGQTGQGAVLNAQADQTRTPEFQNWFGDSKVVDGQGKPLVVYHGTGADFSSFDPDQIGKNYEKGDERGFFFTDNPAEADWAADRGAEMSGGAANVMPVYLALRNPLVVEVPRSAEKRGLGDPSSYYDNNTEEILLAAEQGGHDGVVVRNSERNYATYVAFDPTQIKSAIGNSGAFDPGDANILKQSDRVKTGRDLFRNVIDALGLSDAEIKSTAIDFMTGLPGDMAFLPPYVGGIPDVVQFLHARRLESGLPVLDIKQDADREQLATLITAEALAAIQNAGDSLQWYDKTIGALIAQMAVKFPELDTDPNARNALILATAIGSQGMNVETNLTFAQDQYAEFRKTGKFPEIGKGESAAAMASSFKLANELIAKMGHPAFIEFLKTPYTVKQLTALGYEIGGEKMDELVLGSSIFGPKIGFGFYTNLTGNFEPVTMDMWFMRTIGRLAGTLPAFNQEKFDKQLARFREGLRVRGRANQGIFASQFDRDLVNRARTDLDAAMELARLVKSAHERDFKNNRADYDSGRRQKSEMVAASDTMILSMDKPRDVPGSGGERQLLRDVVRRVVAKVEQQYGQRIPPAALQALIWYPEQELWSALGVKLAVTSQDYAGAAKKILLKEGIDEQRLDAAIIAATQSGPRPVQPVSDGTDTGADQGTGAQNGRDGTGTNPQRGQPDTGSAATEGPASDVLTQGPLGTFNPKTFELALNENSNMSTVHHEMGHAYLEIITKIASEPDAPQAIVDQVERFLKWRGITGTETVGGADSGAPLAQMPAPAGAMTDDSGKPLMLYHGGAKGLTKFQTFGLNFFTVDKKYAKVYADKGRAKGQVYKVYLKIERPFDPSKDPEATRIFNEEYLPFMRENFPSLIENTPELQQGQGLPFIHADQFFNFLRRVKRLGQHQYDGMVVDEGSTPKLAGSSAQYAYVPLDPKQIVNAINGEVLGQDGNLPTDNTQPAGRTPLETWNAMTLDQKRPHHEALAENYEHYLLTGKAPSVELQPLFRKLKSYMLNAYRTLKAFFEANPNVEQKLPPEMVQFYDRMLATEEQIAQAEEVAGLLPQEDATAEALEKLTARSLRDLKWTVNARNKAIKELQKQAAELRKGVEAEVRAEVEELPAFQAKDALDQIRKEGKLQPSQEQLEAVAEKYEYTSADEMLQAIADMGSKADAIQGMTDQRMLERHGDLVDQRAVEEAANEAVHNEARARSLATELKAQAEMVNARTDTGQTNAKGSKITVNALVAAARQFGANIAGRTLIREMRAKANQHLAAERRAGKAWEKATRGAKTEDAVKAKQDQVLNNGAVKALLDADTQVRKLLEYLKKFDSEGTRKKLPPEYVDQIDKLLERVDLRVSTTGKEIDRRASLAKWIDSQHALGLDPILPDNLLEDIQLKSYKEMTFDEFVELTESIKNIEHLGRLKSKLLAAKDKREFDTIVQEWADSIRANGGKPKPVRLEPDSRVVQFFKGAWAEHRKLNSLIRQMDGGEAGGPGFRFLIQSMNERGTQEDVASEKATMALAKIFARVDTLPGGLSGDKRFIPEINNSLSRAGRLAIALNWGNAQNRQRVMGGDNWTEAQVNAILATLTPVELQFVNDIWAHIDSYWPDVKAKQLRVSGTVEEKVEAEPFEITIASPTQTVNGVVTQTAPQVVQMRGGYYPIKYDPDRSIRAQINEAKEIATDMLRGAILRPTTRRGHTKARVEEVQGRPIRKDLAPITQHVSQVVHDLAWHEWAVDANRLLSDPRISAAIREHHGAEIHRAMTESVEAIVVGDLAKQTTIDKLLLQMRANVTRSIMGVSATTALLQPFGLTQSMARIGVVPVLKGAARWAGDAARMESTVEWIHGKSEFMRLRAKTFNRELREINQTIQGKWKATKVLDAVLFYPMQKMQMVADVPTWVGMYEKALAEGRDEDTAVALADEAVLSSQGGGGTQDLAGVQRNLPFLTQFYSYFSTTLNLVAEKTALTNFKNPRAVAGWVGDMALLAIIPAILPALITYALKGGGEDDEPEDIAKKLAEWQASYLLGMFVGLRELPTLWSPFDYGGPPAAKLLNDGKRLVQQAGQGEIDDPAVLAAIGFLGTALGLPTTQIIRSYKGWKAWDEGDAPPTSILFGPPPKN